MIPVNQTISNSKNGDCVRACVASLLECNIEFIPNFMGNSNEGYAQAVKKWGDKLGIIVLDIATDNVDIFQGIHVMAFGKSPNFEDCQHAVIYCDGELSHDPSPSKKGLLGDPLGYTVFMIKNYSIVRNLIKASIEYELSELWFYDEISPGLNENQVKFLKKRNEEKRDE